MVISMSGGVRDCFARSEVVVSPCRTATLMLSSWPHLIVRRSISRLSARSGVI